MRSFRVDIPRSSASARDKALRLLEARLGPSKVLMGTDACERFSRDESEAEGVVPDAVVLAGSSDDIALALAVAAEAEVPITPRAGGTGRSGGAVPVAGGIVLATLGMSAIKGIDRREGVAVVEPGVVLADLHHAVEAEGWFYPPDPNSMKSCAIGGNVAENSGGPRAIKYGVTRDYVLGLEALLVGGERLFSGRRTRKGVTGYDVTSLLVGSEGTLAVFGEVTVKLVPKPEAVVTVLVTFPDVRAAATSAQRLTAERLLPRCVELLDGVTLGALRRAGSPIDPRAGALLLVEVDGAGTEVEAAARRVADLCDEMGALEVLTAQDPARRDRLWAARREMSHALRRLARHKLAQDVVVPRQRVVELLERVHRASGEAGLRYATYGHVADGTVHVNFFWDGEEELPLVEQAIDTLCRDVIQLGGSLSAEHGIGVLRAPYLPLEQSGRLIAVQRDLKRVFDPRGLLNPGKIFPIESASTLVSRSV
jgi:glycolate oxidase